MNRNVGCSTYVFLAIIVMVFLGWTMGKSNDDTNQTVKTESTSTQKMMQKKNP